MRTSGSVSVAAIHTLVIRFVFVSFLIWLPAYAMSQPTAVSYSQPSATIEAYDYLEITATIEKPGVRNPFVDAALSGTFQTKDGTKKWNVDGFCDSADGSIFRIRFMPDQPGAYTYTVTYKQGQYEKSSTGVFEVIDGHRRGTLAIDPEYPWHFIWSGTKEHFFFNGTTAYFLVGWRDERTIDYSIERLHELKVNRMRVLLEGAGDNLLGLEPIMVGDNFTMMLRPWLAKAPGSFEQPGIDFTRFNVPYWQKWERMLRFARDRDMNISVIFYWELDREPISPQMAGSEDEHRYFRYAAARLSAFSNVTWDLGDDLDSFRDEKWAHETGTLLMKWDPYRHLATSHPTRPETPGPRVRLVRLHFHPGVVSRAAPDHARTAADSGQDRPDHSADERRVRLRGSLPAMGANAAGRLRRRAAARGLGYRDGRRVRHRRRDSAPRDQYLAGYRRRLAERTRRRLHGHAQRLRTHGGFFHQLRVVEDGAARRTRQQRGVLSCEAW